MIRYWKAMTLRSVVIISVSFFFLNSPGMSQSGNSWKPDCEDLQATISCLALGLKNISKGWAIVKPLAKAASNFDVVMSAESCIQLASYVIPTNLCKDRSTYKGSSRQKESSLSESFYNCSLRLCKLNGGCAPDELKLAQMMGSKIGTATDEKKNACADLGNEILGALNGSWNFTKGESCMFDAANGNLSDKKGDYHNPYGRCQKYLRCCGQYNSEPGRYEKCKQDICRTGWECTLGTDSDC